jgi:hypothetical protein
MERCDEMTRENTTGIQYDERRNDDAAHDWRVRYGLPSYTIRRTRTHEHGTYTRTRSAPPPRSDTVVGNVHARRASVEQMEGMRRGVRPGEKGVMTKRVTDETDNNVIITITCIYY